MTKKNAEYQILMQSIKKILKERKITYKQLSGKMNLAESSLKRIFTAEDGSVGHIAEICNILNISFFDLFQLAKEEDAPEYRFTLIQEEFFVENPQFFSFFVKLYEDKWSLERIKTYFKLNDRSVFKYLKKLDELDLLELREGFKFSFKVHGTLCFIAQGPLQKKFKSGVAKFVEDLFDQNNNDSRYLHSSDFYVTKKTINETIKNIKTLESEFFRTASRESMILNPDQLKHVRIFLCFAEYPREHLEEITNL